MPKLNKRKPSEKITPRALKLADACAYLGGLSKSTVRRAVKRGLLTPCQATRNWLFQIEELDEFLERGRLLFSAELAAKREAKQAKNGDAE